MILNKTNSNKKNENQIRNIKKLQGGGIEKHLQFDRLFLN